MEEGFTIMETTNIEGDVRDFLTETFLFGRDEALPEDVALLGNVIDSTGVLELVNFLQDRFGIIVDDDEVVPANLGSVKTVVAYVTRKLQAKT
jgi:acyl carrier protein